MFTIPVDGPPPWGASRMVQAFDNWRVGPINRSLFRSPAAATPHTGHSRRSGAVFVQGGSRLAPPPQNVGMEFPAGKPTAQRELETGRDYPRTYRELVKMFPDE